MSDNAPAPSDAHTGSDPSPSTVEKAREGKEGRDDQSSSSTSDLAERHGAPAWQLFIEAEYDELVFKGEEGGTFRVL